MRVIDELAANPEKDERASHEARSHADPDVEAGHDILVEIRQPDHHQSDDEEQDEQNEHHRRDDARFAGFSMGYSVEMPLDGFVVIFLLDGALHEDLVGLRCLSIVPMGDGE